jgi:hypothetical protein
MARFVNLSAETHGQSAPFLFKVGIQSVSLGSVLLRARDEEASSMASLGKILHSAHDEANN